MSDLRGVWPPERPIGGAIRFVIVNQSTSGRSSTWKVWTSKRSDDVYVCETHTGGDWKASHHHDWMWRIAQTREGASATQTERHVVHAWKDVGDQGWTEGAGVLVPCAYLRPGQAVNKAGVIEVPTSPNHSAIHVRILFAEPTARPARLGRGFPIGVIPRVGGGKVYVLAEPVSLSFRAHEALAAAVAEARSARRPDYDYPTPRFVWVAAVENRPFHVDLTID